MSSYEDWTTEELIEARMVQLVVIKEATEDLNEIQKAIAARGKTRRKMKFEEGKAWVGY